MSFNTNFKMGLRELDIIEVSLHQRLNELSKLTAKIITKKCLKFGMFWAIFITKKFGIVQNLLCMWADSSKIINSVVIECAQ